MLNVHIDNQNHVLEFTIAGKITRQEFSDLIAEIEKPMNEWDEIRVLKRFDSFSGMELMALFEDFKFAFENFKLLNKVKKVAIVTDRGWIEKITEIAKNLVPYEVNLFESEDIEEARSWLI